MSNLIIKKRPIEEKKVVKIVELMRKSFEENNLIRQILPVKKVNQSNKEVEFFKIGINQIMDRVWLVSNEGLKTHYAYEEIGKNFGRNIALSEIYGIIKRILDCQNECLHSTVTKKLSQDSLYQTIDTFPNKGFDSIITNIHNIHDFFHMGDFKSLPINKQKFLSGNINDMKVFSFSSIPKDMTLVLNSENFAKIFEKEKINLSIFEKLDKKAVLKSLPKLKNEDFDEKIRILVYETIGFKIEDPESLLILDHK